MKMFLDIETLPTDDKVAEYCRGDVIRARAIYNKLTFNG